MGLLVTATVFGNFADRERRLKNISHAVLTQLWEL
jgi:hypothetical protein